MWTRRSLLAAGAAGMTLTRADAAAPSRLYIGTYTRAGSKGIYSCTFDLGSGKPGAPELAAELPNPTFLTLASRGRYLYAISEVGQWEGQKTGSVHAFSRDDASGKLTTLNVVSSEGAGPCYVSLDPKGKHALVANYGGGSIAVLPIGADGKLAKASDAKQFTGSGPNEKRQNAPHAHCIKTSPDGRYVLASDLGIDQVMSYKLDAASGKLTPSEPASLRVKPGAGPRHFAFHPKLPVLYVINELDSTLTAFRWKDGAGTEIATVSSLPDSFKGENTTAEVVVHPNGRFVYGSNRGHDSIAVFSLERDGKPTLIDHTPTGGRVPRNFVLDPKGKFLLAANQNSNNVLIFRVDADTGKLVPTGDKIELGAPVCLRFVI